MLVSKYKMNSSSENKTIKIQKKMKKLWPGRDLNTQPSDLESDALPLRHQAIRIMEMFSGLVITIYKRGSRGVLHVAISPRWSVKYN